MRHEGTSSNSTARPFWEGAHDEANKKTAGERPRPMFSVLGEQPAASGRWYYYCTSSAQWFAAKRDRIVANNKRRRHETRKNS